jgi:hypothetical protein
VRSRKGDVYFCDGGFEFGVVFLDGSRGDCVFGLLGTLVVEGVVRGGSFGGGRGGVSTSLKRGRGGVTPVLPLECRVRGGVSPEYLVRSRGVLACVVVLRLPLRLCAWLLLLLLPRRWSDGVLGVPPTGPPSRLGGFSGSRRTLMRLGVVGMGAVGGAVGGAVLTTTGAGADVAGIADWPAGVLAGGGDI